MACYVVEKVNDGLNWLATYETHAQAQAHCDELIAKDPRYVDVLAIIDGDDAP